MSVRAHRVLKHPNLTQLNQTELLVLCRLLSHLHEKSGIARPTNETLSKLVGKSERTIRRATKRIQELGIMRIQYGGGASVANRYHFTNPDTQYVHVSEDKPGQQDDRVSVKKPGQNRTNTRTDSALNPDTLNVHRTEERRNGEGAARDNGKHRTGDRSDSEPDTPEAKPDGKQPAYTFQTTAGPWTLTKAQRDDLRERFPFIHVDNELAGLAAWTDANPERRKTPGAMHGWLRARLSAKQAERPLETPAYYGDGFAHKSLPTDPTPDELERIMADD